ncbi:SRPBCC family protein [Gramella sp. AN32]|uniref:SRPBCC family protein n=1 Tax=Christiangramia antarctica TaxID=2058158 RepID=A0ABW5X2D3_9FLAO|nr:SRPBCC family protein [Gramella sp. AN32]MCM4156321.1 polyketide cyclase [Gramella sp. AN32]
MSKLTAITVKTAINANSDKVWSFWTEPEHIKQWNNASPDWYTPKAENDLKKGGKFSSRMEAKDGSMGFDFEGTYDEVIPNKRIKYTLDDGRKVNIAFVKANKGITITETFEPESQNPVDMQRQGWQAILDNFKKYVESR